MKMEAELAIDGSSVHCHRHENTWAPLSKPTYSALPDWGPLWLSELLETKAGENPDMGHEHCLPDPFPFSVHQYPSRPTPSADEALSAQYISWAVRNLLSLKERFKVQEFCLLPLNSV
jgi:hypothetical protein